MEIMQMDVRKAQDGFCVAFDEVIILLSEPFCTSQIRVVILTAWFGLMFAFPAKKLQN